MKIYEMEKLLDLEEKIRSASSVAVSGLAEICDVSLLNEELLKSIADANPNQIDLFYMKSIMVSSGENKNDDVFLPFEMFSARTTPEDKQVNFMHNEKDIIGHITGSILIDDSGNILTLIELDSNLNMHIVATSVIYIAWSDIEQKQRIDNLIAEIKENKWYVSMECLFSDFDYLLSKDNITKVLTRNESTAFLTKHLRSYGGTGVYEGYKVSRILKNLSFSGMGIVSNPANPKSVILNEETNTKGNLMNEELQKEIDALKDQLAKANETIAELSNSKAAAEAEFTKSQGEKDQSLAQLQSEVDALKVSVTELSDAKTQAENKIKEIEEQNRTSARKAALVEAGVDEEDLDTTLSSLSILNDEAFAKMSQMMKKKMKQQVPAKSEVVNVEQTLETAQEVVPVETVKASLTPEDVIDPITDMRTAAAAFFSPIVNPQKPIKK